MTYSFFTGAFAGLLQLAVPSYGLRLHRHFGSRQVGWALVAAFWGLALLNLAGRMGPAGARPEWESARGMVAVVIPLLLLIGLAHIETRFRERARVERELRLRHDDLERCLDRRTEELAEAREEFHRERNRRGEHQRAFAEGARQERLELGVQVATRAGQHLNRHAAVFELYAKLLVAKHSEPRHHPTPRAARGRSRRNAGPGAPTAGLWRLPTGADPIDQSQRPCPTPPAGVADIVRRAPVTCSASVRRMRLWSGRTRNWCGGCWKNWSETPAMQWRMLSA